MMIPKPRIIDQYLDRIGRRQRRRTKTEAEERKRSKYKGEAIPECAEEAIVGSLEFAGGSEVFFARVRLRLAIRSCW
ncbi:hypothetical protein OPV22_020639 [Ensete ventricosum]|uniref:Uncharacterized protein n=1 Tax=Ensete ventricosum TaxID=4639 RepID=A0AAV8QLU0_ENSVE|nr:hypothetical protein OPV22_020639 [Ensete ventricosum]